MLLSLMYHHINSDQYSNNSELIEEHFKYISNNYITIFPREYVFDLTTKLCLVFDDGYFDFYYYVFPLLKKYNIKALLSVPVKYILDEVFVKDKIRLSQKHSTLMSEENYKTYAPYCSWRELKEMSDSGFVQIVSHGYNHIKLDDISKEELQFELEESKKTIESKLEIDCDTFVYPYGNFNTEVLNEVNKYYDYNFAISSMYNFNIKNKPIYRIYADDMQKCDELFLWGNKIKYILRNIKFIVKKVLKK